MDVFGAAVVGASQDGSRIRDGLSGRGQQAPQGASDSGKASSQADLASAAYKTAALEKPSNTAIAAPEQVARTERGDSQPAKYPSDPDRVTLSRDALLASRDNASQGAGEGAVIDNETGELVPVKPEPQQQSRQALSAYNSIQGLSGI